MMHREDVYALAIILAIELSVMGALYLFIFWLTST